MKSNYLAVAAAAGLVAASGVAGAWVGARLFHSSHHTHKEFHHELFSELRLNAQQQKLLDAEEARHAIEEKTLRRNLSSANHAFADALASETAYDEDVDNAIIRVHEATLDLQRSSVRHLYAMREIFNDSQKEIFDRHVAETLRTYANQPID